MTIFLDTTPLVALCDPGDAKHRGAIKDVDRRLASGEFAVCDAVITEASFHLPWRNRRQRLRALLEDLAAEPVPAANGLDLWLEVFAWLTNYADHEPDWADGCLAVLSGRYPDAEVWTYDREFRTTWRRPNGNPIPLAVRLI